MASVKDLPKVDVGIKGQIESFSSDKLKHTETTEKAALPTKEDIEGEKKEQDLRKSVECFDSSKLKNCETVVKNPLPTKEVIEQEKANA